MLILARGTSPAISRSVHELPMHGRYDQWIANFRRVFKDSTEKAHRFQIFTANVKFIEAFNRAGHSYNLSINAFAYLTNEEFIVTHNGFRTPQERSSSKSNSFMYENITDIPPSVDWRESGDVTPIKDQGQCGKQH